nr:MAG TPA: hypothetical protein [Caudoviricetes sp.]
MIRSKTGQKAILLRFICAVQLLCIRYVECTCTLQET